MDASYKHSSFLRHIWLGNMTSWIPISSIFTFLFTFFILSLACYENLVKLKFQMHDDDCGHDIFCIVQNVFLWGKKRDFERKNMEKII